jgi:hypothetical protein
MENNNITCPICLDNIDFDIENENDSVIIYQCKHSFHYKCAKACVKSQFENNVDISCPVCRHVFLAKDTHAYIQRQQQHISENNNNSLNTTHHLINIFELRRNCSYTLFSIISTLLFVTVGFLILYSLQFI